MKLKTDKRSSYDWIKIKREFFNSNYSEVSIFLKEAYGINSSKNGAISRRVKGWRNEKNEMKWKALEKSKAKIVESYVPTAIELSQMHKATISLCKIILQDIISECLRFDENWNQIVVKRPDIKTVVKIWKIVKAEQSELRKNPVQEQAEVSKENDELIRMLIEQNYDDNE